MSRPLILIILALTGFAAIASPAKEVVHPSIHPFADSRQVGRPIVEELGEMRVSFRDEGRRVRRTLEGRFWSLEYETDVPGSNGEPVSSEVIVDHFQSEVERLDATVRREDDNRLLFSFSRSDGGETWCRVWATGGSYTLEIVDVDVPQGVTTPTGETTAPPDATREGASPNPADGEEPDLLATIYFADASASLRPGAGAKLDQVAQKLLDRPTLRAEIHGHRDAGETAAEISDQRALAVVNVLILYGIDAARLEAKDFGASRPLAHNPADATENRRVTVFAFR